MPVDAVNAVLVEYPALCAQDLRFERLRAALLAGVPGQPKSAQLVDLPAAERAWFNLALKAGRERPAEAAAALVGAGKCAYAAGRLTQQHKRVQSVFPAVFLLTIRETCEPSIVAPIG